MTAMHHAEQILGPLFVLLASFVNIGRQPGKQVLGFIATTDIIFSVHNPQASSLWMEGKLSRNLPCFAAYYTWVREHIAQLPLL